MTRSTHFLIASLCLCLTAAVLTAQQSNAAEASIPHLIPFSGVLKDVHETPVQGTVAVTLALYKDEQGGAPLWMETQNVTPDASGHYSVMLGATKNDGVPAELFVSKEARWLGVESQGLPAPARILLLSVPYALKAADAETIGGLPPSAFVLASPVGSASPSKPDSTQTAPPPASGVTTSGGTPNVLALFQSATDIENSAVSQTGSGATAKIGINNTAPASTLDVKGKVTVRGTLSLPASGVATATAGANSQPANLSASSFDSATSTAVAQTFQLKAEPAGNDTATPSGTLNLLFGTGTTAPAETGLKIANNGQIAFAAGQTFPGTGIGSITGVTAGTDLTGGGTSGNVTVNVDTTKVVTAVLAGTDLTGGGTGGVLTLNLDTTKVPLLNAANIFTASQTVTGNLTATGVVTGSGYQIGSNLFAFGSFTNANAFLGFAGNTTMSGVGNVGAGSSALSANTFGGNNTAFGGNTLAKNTTGNSNTAGGVGALFDNTTGTDNAAYGDRALSANTTGDNNTALGAVTLYDTSTGGSNTAAGVGALETNSTGSFNTAIGYAAGQPVPFDHVIGNNNTAVGANSAFASGSLTNATAIGAQAEVTASNALILGSINGVNGATADTNVGIGITAPTFKLHVGLGNNGFRVEGPKLTGTGLPMASFGGYGDVAVDAPGVAGGRFVVKESGLVGIGFAANPTRIFTIGINQGHALADGWDVYSSRRWKTNIHPLNDALHKVEQLRGVSYDMKASGKHEIGVIAEEVGKVLPEVVTFEANGKDAQSVDYSRLTALLIEAMKEQQGEIQKQLAVLRAQSKSIRSLRSELQQTRQTLALIRTQLETKKPMLAAVR